jgi:peptidyl-prolyl cis-trans isomerase SurA
MKSLIAAALLASLLALSPGARAQSATTPVDSIAAVIDEDVILRSELDRAVNNIVAQYGNSTTQQLPPRDVLEKQVLERLVMLRLQVARANDSGIRVSDAEIQQAVAGIASQNRMSMEQLRQRLATDGIAYDEFVGNLRDEMLVQRLRQRFIQSRVQVSEGEVDQLLATRDVGNHEVRLATILISLPEGATPAQVRDAATKISEIKAAVERGEMDFRSAAIRHSQAPNALEGGEIGWRSLDAIPPAFVNIIRGLTPGQITEPVRSSTGFQIIQLEETREGQAQKATQYSALDILVRTSDVVSAEQARQKIQAMRDRIVAGEDFGKVAREGSDDTLTRNKGGDMGWFLIDQWGGAVATQLQQLADGELSPIFQSDAGFHLIKRIGKREQDVTEENRRNQARSIIGERKGDEEYERFLRQLRSEAFVESRLSGS